MWLCQHYAYENDETSTICDNCGALRDDDIGESGDNKTQKTSFRRRRNLSCMAEKIHDF